MSSTVFRQANNAAYLRRSPRKRKPARVNQFILKEAHCDDDINDGAGSGDEQDESDTDLSGFIVDDDADLSFYDSAESADSEVEEVGRGSKTAANRGGTRRRRLCRGSRNNHDDRPKSRTGGYIDLTREEEEEDDDDDDDDDDHSNGLSSALERMKIGGSNTSPDQPANKKTNKAVDFIDLTSSPLHAAAPGRAAARNSDKSDPFVTDPTSNLASDLEQKLRLSPPKLSSQSVKRLEGWDSDSDDKGQSNTGNKSRNQAPEPSPQTPSKTKLASPSKLPSPSKSNSNVERRAPYRQSTDAFWDLGTINEWNDINSPKKTPAPSPGKSRRQHFRIWSDDSDDSRDLSDDNSLPSPLKSPTKQNKSPCKSPVKEEMRRIAEERKAEKARKAAFDAAKRGLAQDLFNELDAAITEGNIARLSASTGGVKIEWSKTLRSTAGRANWRRSVTKNNKSGSPTKETGGFNSASDGEVAATVTIQHFASIELAEKVIDCEERLVNTLAHEYCHLANFMISNVCDQPHGASFKRWAARVTQHLQMSDNKVWKQVKVTTKHGYAISHKYLWACAGQQPTTKAMDFLNIQGRDSEGCGAEYGRHSKSIDPERSRCGRCRGKLVQVRPKPRLATRMKNDPRSG